MPNETVCKRNSLERGDDPRRVLLEIDWLAPFQALFCHWSSVDITVSTILTLFFITPKSIRTHMDDTLYTERRR